MDTKQRLREKLRAKKEERLGGRRTGSGGDSVENSMTSMQDALLKLAGDDVDALTFVQHAMKNPKQVSTLVQQAAKKTPKGNDPIPQEVSSDEEECVPNHFVQEMGESVVQETNTLKKR